MPATLLEPLPSHPNILLKREDLSETGSHKWRYLKPRLEQLKKEGVTQVVISTSGNAGITASHYGKKLGIKVLCLVSEHGEMDKAAAIEQEGGFLVATSHPIHWAKYFSRKYGIHNLRGSEDPDAIEHYKTLGKEIIEQAPDANAVVNFCSSGISTLGILRSYEEWAIDENNATHIPRFILAQNGRGAGLVHLLKTEELPNGYENEHPGPPDLPLRVGLYRELCRLIGNDWRDAYYVTNDQIDDMQTRFFTARESAASLFIAKYLLRKGTLEGEKVVVIISGKAWTPVDFRPNHSIESIQDADNIYRTFCTI
ncbi:MAG: PLP-dependent lyase/thiolase [bacterium]|nr:PLP-dependent lyase/thiolase [bacterium]